MLSLQVKKRSIHNVDGSLETTFNLLVRKPTLWSHTYNVTMRLQKITSTQLWMHLQGFMRKTCELICEISGEGLSGLAVVVCVCVFK